MGLSTGGGGGLGEGGTAIWFIASSFLQSKTQKQYFHHETNKNITIWPNTSLSSFKKPDKFSVGHVESICPGRSLCPLLDYFLSLSSCWPAPNYSSCVLVSLVKVKPTGNRIYGSESDGLTQFYIQTLDQLLFRHMNSSCVLLQLINNIHVCNDDGAKYAMFSYRSSFSKMTNQEISSNFSISCCKVVGNVSEEKFSWTVQ